MSAADKADLRSEFGQRRRALTQADIETARIAVRTAVLHRAEEAGWRTVAAYSPLRVEPGSVDLLDSLTAMGTSVLVPVMLPDRDLDWIHWRQPERSLGVSAIAECDAVLVPALAVAHDGTRLGRGGGSYDRALARVVGELPIAALLFEGEYVHELPHEPWDMPVTAVVTPAGWIDLD